MNIATVTDRLFDMLSNGRDADSASHSISQEINRIDKRVVSLVSPESFEAEQYRKLRYVLEERQIEGGSVMVGVTSPGAQGGKSLTALNLAASLAQVPGTKVLLLDVDFRRQTAALCSQLGLRRPVGKGLADLIVNEREGLAAAVKWFSQFNLSVVPAGDDCVGAHELVRSPHFAKIMNEARSQYDYVIVDTPPLLPVSDCHVIGRFLDGYLVLVTANRTPREMLEETLIALDPEKVIGLVLNRTDKPLPRYYGYGYYDYAAPAHRGHRRRRR